MTAYAIKRRVFTNSLEKANIYLITNYCNKVINQLQNKLLIKQNRMEQKISAYFRTSAKHN